jgi:ribosomal subunit interface protein
MDAAEIVVTGHDVPGIDRYRSYLSEKLRKLDHLNRSVIRYDVELTHEPSPRGSESAERVVITSHGTGPAVRAEADGADVHAVLDEAIGKLEGRLRRNHDRRVRRRSRGGRTTIGTGRA